MAESLRIDRSAVAAAFDRHRASPEVSFAEHVRNSQLALAKSLKGRKAVYLDTKYWIIFRDAAMGRVTKEGGPALLQLLRELVEEDSAFCPISESIFAELFKQRDANTRRATAALIDELSAGVTLIPVYDRIPLELQHLIEKRLGRNDRPRPSDLVWLKVAYSLGLMQQTETSFDPATALVIQKAFFDYLWSVSMTEIVGQIGDSQSPDLDRFDATATRLNVANAQHARDLTSFGQTYDIETVGAVDLIAPIAAEIMVEMAERTAGRQVPRFGSDWDAVVNGWKANLLEAMNSDEGKDILRTIHINTCLHASLRWNKGHRFEGNDFYDFHHAQTALGYCDLFLTERPLKAMVTASHVALDKRYGCEVVATIDDALAALRQFERNIR